MRVVGSADSRVRWSLALALSLSLSRSRSRSLSLSLHLPHSHGATKKVAAAAAGLVGMKTLHRNRGAALVDQVAPTQRNRPLAPADAPAPAGTSDDRPPRKRCAPADAPAPAGACDDRPRRRPSASPSPDGHGAAPSLTTRHSTPPRPPPSSSQAPRSRSRDEERRSSVRRATTARRREEKRANVERLFYCLAGGAPSPEQLRAVCKALGLRPSRNDAADAEQRLLDCIEAELRKVRFAADESFVPTRAQMELTGSPDKFFKAVGNRRITFAEVLETCARLRKPPRL